MKAKGELVRKIFITSEEDLPEEGEYVQLCSKGKCVYDTYHEVSKDRWLKEVSWYLRLVKQDDILQKHTVYTEDKNSPCYMCHQKCSEYCAHSCTREEEYLKLIP